MQAATTGAAVAQAMATTEPMRREEAVAWMRERAPASLQGDAFLGLEPWQWVGALLLLVAGLLLASALRRVVGFALVRWLRHDGQKPDVASVRRASRPFGLFAAGLLWEWGLPLSGASGVALEALLGGVRLFTVVMGAWAAFRVADFIAAGMARRAARTESKLDDLLVPLVRKTMKGLAGVVALLYALQGVGVAVGPLVASVGIGGLAVAFAAKDTIENFFGSIAVILDHPFEVGDTIVVAGVRGEVEEVGFRSTRLRTQEGSLVTLPNATLVRATVERLAPRGSRGTTLTLRLDPSTKPDVIAQAAAGVRELLARDADAGGSASEVRVHDVGERGVELILKLRLPAAVGAQDEAAVRERLLLDALRVLERLSVRTATGGRDPGRTA